jgi:Putative peptidoglycan binding domain/Domain of Unknown Function (DUF748)
MKPSRRFVSLRRAYAVRALALAAVAATACAGQSPPPPRPAAIARPTVPPGPADAIRVDARWAAVEVVAEPEPTLEATAIVQQPSIRIFLPPRPPQDREAPPTFRIATVPDALRDLLAVDVERFEAHSGEIFLTELEGRQTPPLWIHDLELGIENAATRRHLLEGFPSLLAIRGQVQRTGKLSAFVSANPFAGGLAFAGRASVVGLDLREVAPWLGADTGIRPTGMADAFMVFSSQHGRIRGAVKVIVHGVEVEPAGGGFWPWLKAHTVDVVVDLFSRNDEADVLATVVPLEGELRDPAVQVWPAVFGILYNAFVEGLAASYAGLPLDRARTPQRPPEQAWRVLIEDKRPRAQPRPVSVVARPTAERAETALGEIPLSLSPAGLLRPGAERLLQKALIRRGALSPGHVTGKLDETTRAGLARFQADVGLAATGLPTYSTVRALGLAAAEVFAQAMSDSSGERRRENDRDRFATA